MLYWMVESIAITNMNTTTKACSGNERIYVYFVWKKRKYEYNNIDSVSRMLVYDDDGDLNEEWTYEYDSQKDW